MEVEPQNTPSKESRQFYFGSLLKDSNTLLREWPHAHFAPDFGAEIWPRTTVTEAAGREKFVDGPAFTADFAARPSRSAVPPFTWGCQAYWTFPEVGTISEPATGAAGFFSASS